MKVRHLLGTAEFLEQEQAVPDFCLPKAAVGLEYEWENTKKWPSAEQVEEDVGLAPIVKEVIKYFDFHVDGSLRVNGMEFTFKGPFSGSKILRATNAMDDCARSLGFTGSYRTSMHVHIDMQDTTFPDDVKQLGAVYCIVEPFLYQFVGNSRNTSNYCIPWYKHPQHFENFLDTITRQHKDGTSTVLPYLRSHKGDKYAGLNCFALGQFGSVEYRQAPVTMQRDKILTWINLLMRIKQWTTTNPKTSVGVLDHCNRIGAYQFLQEVFKTHYADVTRLSRNIEGDVWSGLETLYQYVACG